MEFKINTYPKLLIGYSMSRTIFWSWQSDRSERETRHLIREALVMALDWLTGDSDIEERLEIDHDTRGLPGSPDIVASILEKIELSSVFVADITPIAISDGGKHVANPNVLIELGYAKRALGTARVVTVWNTAFTQSRPEDLPFDLRGRRGPITYSLDSGATREELGNARKLVIDGLADRIGACLEHLPPSPKAAAPWHKGINGDPSIWVPPGDVIQVNEDWGSGTKIFTDGGRWYVRILPSKFEPTSLDAVSHGPVVGNYGGFSAGHVTGGLMTYSGSVRADIPPELNAASIWFRNTGEIWAFQTQIGSEYRGRQVFFGDHIPKQWAVVLASGLKKLVKAGALGPYRVRVGVTGLSGLHWDVGNSYGGAPPVALESELEVEFEISGIDPSDWKRGILDAWIALRQLFALPPPDDTIVESAFQEANR
jgi:hypothetical protein